MKKTIIILTTITFFTLGVNAQTKKDGTPDMRYKANKETYGNSYSTPSTQNQGQKEITAMVVNTECKTVTKKVMAHMLLLTLRQHQTIIHTTITSRESRKNYLPCPTILI
jgi:hypothetical protein